MIGEKIFSIISYYLAFYFEYVNLCSITKTKHQFKIINFVLIGIISAINYFLTLSGIIIVKMVASFLVILFVTNFMIKTNKKESIVASIEYYIMIVIIEYMFEFVIVDLLKYDPNKYLASAGIQKCISGYIITLITFLLCKLKKVNKVYVTACNISEKLNIKYRYIWYFVISMFIMQMMYITNMAGKISTMYCLLYVAIFMIFTLYLVISLYKYYYLKVLNKFLLDNDKNMQKILDEYKLFQHNIKNDLLAISSVSNKKVKEMIAEYMHSYSLDVDGINNISSMPDGLRGVIYQKLINQNKISSTIIVDNYIENDPMNQLNIRDYRLLVESLGILIDNSLEAISANDNDYIYVYLNESTDSYMIRCVNTFSNKIDLDKIMNIGNSSKKGHKGMGLYYIKNRTKFNYHSKIINSKFYSELIVKK